MRRDQPPGMSLPFDALPTSSRPISWRALRLCRHPDQRILGCPTSRDSTRKHSFAKFEDKQQDFKRVVVCMK